MTNGAGKPQGVPASLGSYLGPQGCPSLCGNLGCLSPSAGQYSSSLEPESPDSLLGLCSPLGSAKVQELKAVTFKKTAASFKLLRAELRRSFPNPAVAKGWSWLGVEAVSRVENAPWSCLC